MKKWAKRISAATGAVLVSWVAALPLQVQSGEGKRPNIVFIISDDQDWRHFGFMGGEAHTPTLDRMVEQGIYLTDFNGKTGSGLDIRH